MLATPRIGKRAHRLTDSRLWGAWILLLVFPTFPAWAHRLGPARAASADTILIPSLSHGQMAVIAANRAAILGLADRQAATDAVFRRLLNFISIQHAVCMWGVVPGSLEDEDSPFNECTHAYLAATRALLLHMQHMASGKGSVRELGAKVERELASDGAALAICRFSDEPFNTGEVIQPRWRDVPFHPRSLAAFVGLALALAFGAMLAARCQRGPQAAARESPKIANA